MRNIIEAWLAPIIPLMAGVFIIALFILLAIAAVKGTYDD